MKALRDVSVGYQAQSHFLYELYDSSVNKDLIKFWNANYGHATNSQLTSGFNSIALINFITSKVVASMIKYQQKRNKHRNNTQTV